MSDKMTYMSIDTDTTIATTAKALHGVCVISKTTGTVSVVIYDASATATGTIVLGATVTGGTNNGHSVMLSGGVVCRTGIHADVSCTSGADRVIVFYGNP